MSDQWTDRLSEYLDDELPPAERAALEAHVRHCVACGAALADLKRIVARARGLEDRAPDSDPWPGIVARIGVGTADTGGGDLRGARQRRRWSLSLPQLAAAGIALMALSGGTAWLLHPGTTPVAVQGTPAPAAGLRAPGVVVPGLVVPASVPVRSYDGAVADLERVLAEGRGRLDSATVSVIERNLATIDSAIVQAERALAADSANGYLNSHLADTMRRKLELLRRAAALVSSVS